eukprot:scaffold128471_cov20-Tisochrysis_lutea.AAC.1
MGANASMVTYWRTHLASLQGNAQIWVKQGSRRFGQKQRDVNKGGQECEHSAQHRGFATQMCRAIGSGPRSMARHVFKCFAVPCKKQTTGSVGTVILVMQRHQKKSMLKGAQDEGRDRQY